MTLFEADTTELLGSNARVDISFVNSAPPRLRGLTHVFQQDEVDGEFVEQIFVSPFSDQAQDRCGYSVAIYSDYAFVGCPNRDTSVSNANAGSALVFYTSLLKFSNKTYEVEENVGTTNMTVERFANFSYDVFFFIHSVDRNSDALTQLFLQQLYGVKDAYVSYPATSSC